MYEHVAVSGGLFGSAGGGCISPPESVGVGSLFGTSSVGRRSAGVMSPSRPVALGPVAKYREDQVCAGFATLFGPTMTTFSGRRVRFVPGCRLSFAETVPVVLNHDRAREVATTGDSSLRLTVNHRGLLAMFFVRDNLRAAWLLGEIRKGNLGMSLEYRAFDRHEGPGSTLQVESALVSEITLTEAPAGKGTRVVVAAAAKTARRKLELALREDRAWHKH